MHAAHVLAIFPFSLNIYGQVNLHSVQQIGSFHIFLNMLSNLYVFKIINSKCRGRKKIICFEIIQSVRSSDNYSVAQDNSGAC